MFKYFKEMRELKKTKLQLETVLISKLFNFVDGLPDVVELAKRAKDMDTTEVQKMIVEELVTHIKNKEESAPTENDGE